MKSKKNSIYALILSIFIIIFINNCSNRYTNESGANNGIENINSPEVFDTKKFLGSEDTWKDIQIQLNNIHGLWGGANTYISGSGRSTVLIVEPNRNQTSGPIQFVKRKYTFSLNQTETRKLIGIFIENDFVNIKVEERLGIPDETKPEIVLINPRGKNYSISKWANDKNDRFDNILKSIDLVVDQTQNLTPDLE
ncbi:MAG: hypothetical protein AABX33_03810 [Nanoarchaeota archaeon]